MENIISHKWNKKVNSSAVLMSDKINKRFFIWKLVTREKESHSLPIRVVLHQENIIILNTCLLDTGIPSFIKTNTAKCKNTD